MQRRDEVRQEPALLWNKNGSLPEQQSSQKWYDKGLFEERSFIIDLARASRFFSDGFADDDH